MFPGQGSQKKGMGDGLFDEFKELTDKADLILGYSITQLCREDPDKKLGETLYTQPALFTVNALMYLKKIKETSKKPDYVAGHSLGEYSALFAAGVFDFETGLRLVQKRGELMSQASGGGMAAIIGLSGEKVDAIIRERNLNTISIANYNGLSQIVISGPRKDIDSARTLFEESGARMYIVLPVSGAFHSQYMNEAKEVFATFLEQFPFSEPTIPVISNTYARPYEHDRIKVTLTNQITCSVQWVESIRYLMGCGEMSFEEIGPGAVLTNLVRQIQKETATPVVPAQKKALMNDAKNGTETIPDGDEGKDSGEMKDRLPLIGNVKAHDRRDQVKKPEITAETLGSEEYKKEYNLKYAYYAGGMYKEIASKELVVRMGKAGMMSYYGSGGVDSKTIEKAIIFIQQELNKGEPYGFNLIYHLNDPDVEERIVDLYLRYGVKNVEAAAYLQLSRALVCYRVTGLSRAADGSIITGNKIVGKISRPEIAEIFLSPPPDQIIRKLVEDNRITEEQAALAKEVPMADDLCVEADSAGHTDRGVAYTLMPAIIKLRDEMMTKYRYPRKVRVGAAGGIGTPEAAAAAFILGADFIVTGSINQCTVEAGASQLVKEMLSQMNVQDTDYAPAGDMFELGAKVQVLRKGVFFPARANKLYELYRQYNSLDQIDEKTKKQLQEKLFMKSFREIYDDCKEFYSRDVIEKAERNPKQKMALVFRWYFGRSTRLALEGKEENKVDFQIQCGSALGAFNQWVKGTELEDWKNRHVDTIGLTLLRATAKLLTERFEHMQNGGAVSGGRTDCSRSVIPTPCSISGRAATPRMATDTHCPAVRS